MRALPDWTLEAGVVSQNVPLSEISLRTLNVLGIACIS